MNDTPGAPSSQTAPRKASSVRIILMLALGGPVLAIGGCALFLANLNIEGHGSGSDNLSAAGAIVFVAGCLAFIVGVIWALVRWVDRRFAKAASTPGTSTPSTPGTVSTLSTDRDS